MTNMIKKNKFSILVALIITYLSLTSSHTFDKIPLINIPNFDKVVHFGMYFGFMSVIILENRKTIKGTSQLFLIGLIPLLFGVLMEILQATLTVTRSGSFYDALANSVGILVSILLWLWIKPLKKDIIR
jgi:VanZ family protein